MNIEVRSRLALIAHELVHTYQCRELGGIGNFGYHYLAAFFEKGYDSSPLEWQARCFEAGIRKLVNIKLVDTSSAYKDDLCINELMEPLQSLASPKTPPTDPTSSTASTPISDFFPAILQIIFDEDNTGDVAKDFSPVNNPNGVWSYGTIGTHSAVFQRYTQPFNNNGIFGWTNTASGTVEYNNTDQPITQGQQTWQPRTLSIHNGPVGNGDTMDAQVSVVRFTAPMAGTYTISGSFYPGDTNADVTVEIIKNWDTQNSLNIFEDRRVGKATKSFLLTAIQLDKYTTIDFAVGGRYYFGNTGLDVKITRQ